MRIFLICAALFAAPIITSALQLPTVSVLDVSLDKATYAQGETIHGTAVIVNDSSETVANAVYIVRLVGAYEGRIPRAEYASQTSEPFTIESQGRKDIQFDLPLPPNTAGDDLGVEVQAQLPSGLPLGWQDVRITVEGESGLLTFDGASVEVDGQSFPPQAGPSIREGMTATLAVDIANPLSEDMRLTPQIIIYDRSAQSQKEVARVNPDTFTVPAGGNAAQRFALPDLGYAPGVYEGSLQLFDAAGVPRATQLLFRYLVHGDTAVIHLVSSDTEGGRAGETVLVSVSFSGPPDDLLEGPFRDTGGASIDVTLFDVNDRAVGNGHMAIDLAQDDAAAVPVVLSQDASSVRADVTILRGSTVLASTSAPLSAEYDSLRAAAMKPAAESTSPASYLILFALIAVLLIGGGILLYQKSNAPKLMIAVFAIALGASLPSLTYAFTVTSGGGIAIYVNTPTGVYQPGQQFYIDGYALITKCVNDPQTANITVSYPTGNWSKSWSKYYGENIKGHWTSTNKERFSYGPFNAPQTPGTYRVYVSASAHQNSGGSNSTSGYQEFTVQDPCNQPRAYCSGSDVYYGDTRYSYCPQTKTASCVPPASMGCSAGACLPPADPEFGDFSDGSGSGNGNGTGGTGTGGSSGSAVLDGGESATGGPVGAFRPTGHLQVNPRLVRRNETSRVYWSVRNVTSCTVTGSNGDSFPAGCRNNLCSSGLLGVETSNLLTKTVYTLSCAAIPGANPATVTEQQTVNIIPTYQEI